MDAADATPALVERLFRAEASRLAAHFARRFGPAHLDLAEEVVQDALVKALQQWPFAGVPREPAAWLFRVACHGALDIIRRRRAFGARAQDIARTLARERDAGAALPTAADPAWADDELRMVLMCCHPRLPPAARLVLSLKVVGGLSVPEVARALLSDERAVAQRLVRAKRAIRTRGLTLDLPPGRALARRIDSALDVIYLMFTAGHGPVGEHLVRADICHEAIRLGAIIATAPVAATPRAHALVALMAFHAARLPARVDASGEIVRLEAQDRARWDHGLIAFGFRHFERAIEGPQESSFHLQAAIAAAHAAAPEAAATDWRHILSLYDALVIVDPSPVAQLNRAVAVAKVHGPPAGLAATAAVARRPALRTYALLHAVRADLFLQAGRIPQARLAYRAALACPCADAERRFLARQLIEISGPAAAGRTGRKGPHR